MVAQSTMESTAQSPTILFMGRIFDVPWGGVREMAVGLLRAAAPLCEAEGRRIEVLVSRRGICPVTSPAIREVVLPKLSWNRALWDHVTVSNYANTRRNAVLFNVKLVLPERLQIPGFTVIHDLMYFPQPAKYNWREYLLMDTLYMRWGVRRTVRRAPFTYVVSEATARDARELFPEVPAERFIPIHHGVDVERWGIRDEKAWKRMAGIGVREPFVFYSGGLSRRKNVAVLARAFARFLAKHPDYQLVITGGAKPTTRDHQLRRALNMIPPGKIIRTGEVDDAELAALYQHAAFFVFPSLYEGFGLPPLEAQAAGCPVICSDATSLPEVVGDSALLFNPKSRALLSCMESLTHEPMRRELIAKGGRNVQRFRWESTARKWLALADRVHAAQGASR
ncbi:glycosyltransferase family 4 protein [Candidatus Sumerlaeota bacterium]|nr:glycosyltransferase family 4 protein [Candidatus Sumerlaeota bacterium]